MARVLFLQKLWTENLGPMYLSALAGKHGHVCDLIIEDRGNRDSEIRGFNPDLIAFSVTTGMHIWATVRATELKKDMNCPIIIGGAHATYYPELIEYPAIDLICRGEGETAFLEILERLDGGKDLLNIPNTWCKDGADIQKNELGNLIEDLDTLPLPDRMLYYKYDFLKNNENKAFISGRGCPYSCTYCSIAGLRDLYRGKGRFVRFHSAERVIEEIRDVRDRYGLRSVIFQDDTFIIGPDRLQELLALYGSEIALPFVCHIRADILTPEIARQLKQAGCHSVDFGLESGDENLRATILGKKIGNDQYHAAAAYLKESGIRFRTTNMFGLPGETLEQAWETVRLNQELGTHYPSASLYQPYPRTTLGDQVIGQGLVGDEYCVDTIGSTFFRTSLLNSPHKNAFINLQKLFWPAVRIPTLMPIIRRLIKLPPNPIFEAFFLFFYAMNYALSEKVSIRRVINLGRHTARSVFFGK